MHRQWPKWTLAGVTVGLALLLVSLLFLRFALIGVGNDRFEPALLTVTVTFAVFAVNFSFLEYQLSPYRALFRGIAWRHVLSAVGVLALALVPVGAALLGYWPARVSSAVLPIVALSSVVLTIVARSCADPTNRIRFCLSKKRLSQFLTRFAAATHEELEAVEEFGLSSPGEEPSHEWDQRIAPRIDFFDPFDSVMALANAALSGGDGQTFDLAADAVLKLLAMVTSEKELLLSDGTKADYKVRSVVLNHAHDRLVQLARMTLEADKTDRFSRSLADILGSYLRLEAAHSRQADEYSRMVTGTLAFIAMESMKRGWGTSPLRALMIARECANKGLHKTPRVGNMLVRSYLYPAAVKAGVLTTTNIKVMRTVRKKGKKEKAEVEVPIYFDKTGKRVKRFGFHEFRHSLSSYLTTKKKVDPKTAQTALRHSSVKFMLDMQRPSSAGDVLKECFHRSCKQF